MNPLQDACIAQLKEICVSKEDFEHFQTCTNKYRAQVVGELASINTALFAKDANNVHEQVGLMVTARNIDKHITVTCNLVRWTIAGIVGTASLFTALHALGVV